jgi:hypothetical protein
MLTDEQICAIIGNSAVWSVTEEEMIAGMLQAAYRLGMLRAAAVCEDISTGIAHEYMENCADAIRAAAAE